MRVHVESETIPTWKLHGMNYPVQDIQNVVNAATATGTPKCISTRIPFGMSTLGISVEFDPKKPNTLRIEES